MQEKKFTCPFTGVEFTALEYMDGHIIARHALTGEEIHMNWNCTINRYNIPRNAFKHIETVSMVEAAEILDVSRQRISKIAADGVIQAHEVAGSTVFILSEVLEYKRNRKTGAPFRSVENGAGDYQRDR